MLYKSFSVCQNKNQEKKRRVSFFECKSITHIGRSLSLCPNVFSLNCLIEHDLIRREITSEDEQVCL
jgi:hypothetical protein